MPQFHFQIHVWDFPGILVVGGLHFCCRGHRFDPWWGDKIPHVVWHSKKKKKEEEQDPNISLTEVQIQNFQVIYSLTNALNKHLMSLLCSNNWPGKRRYHDGISQEPI